MKKQLRNIILGGVIFGGILLILEQGFQIPKKVISRYYIILSGIIIIGAVFIDILWQRRFIEKLKGLERILREEKNPDKFIEENKKLLQTVKANYNKALIYINLSAGYCDKGDYETAKEILISTPLKGLKGINEIIYYLNLTYIYFRLGENRKALEILERHNKDFSKLEKHPKLGGHIAVVKILESLIQNNVSQAEALLSTSKEKWKDERLLEDWEYLQNKIDKLKE